MTSNDLFVVEFPTKQGVKFPATAPKTKTRKKTTIKVFDDLAESLNYIKQLRENGYDPRSWEITKTEIGAS